MADNRAQAGREWSFQRLLQAIACARAYADAENRPCWIVKYKYELSNIDDYDVVGRLDMIPPPHEVWRQVDPSPAGGVAP